MSEFKPGTVATSNLGHLFLTDDGWVFDDNSGPVSHHESIRGFRPLVVLDPEDREQVERLIGALESRSFSSWACGAVVCMQAALREFANPTPPKPDEPQGLGAVVEDVKGVRWVRTHESFDAHWRRGNFDGNYRPYADIDVVRVLSEGVTA